MSTARELLATNGVVTLEEMEKALPEIKVMEEERKPVTDHHIYSPRSSLYMIGTQVNHEKILEVRPKN